ncbi:MAG TPA: methylaspartate mutase subunit E [Syntrophorhabdaceae bacterium]|nr:methylaspartate mutase subunit E [Syntrophorhabdaceae bacterium]
MNVSNRRLTDEEFFNERKEVLAMWPTGKDVDLEEAIAYHKSMPRNKNFVYKLLDARQRGEIPLVSDMGYTTIELETELLQYIQKHGQPDFLGHHVDSLTRNLRFAEAEKQVRKAEATGENLLNGFPVVIHGVSGNRKLTESVDLPVRLRFVSPTGRLTTEIALAGGNTSAEGQQMLCFMNYTGRDERPETVIREFQYISRLIGYYEEHGVPILVHVVGGNHLSNMTPPSLQLALSIIDLLMLPEQGVVHPYVGMASAGNLAQDVAYAIACRTLGNEYLKKLGYDNVLLMTGGAEIPGRYPLDHAQSFTEVIWSPLVSTLADVDLCHIKTLDEADTIPTKENNATSLRGARMMLNLLKDQKLDIRDNKDVIAETKMIEMETRAILDKVLELGDGDPVTGTIKALEFGVLDHPMSNNKHVQARVMGVRDTKGAVRYLECGNLPFPKEVVEFHRDKLAERERKIGKAVDFDIVIADFLAISTGSLLPDLK